MIIGYMNAWEAIRGLANLNDRVAKKPSDSPACILVRDKEVGGALVLLTAANHNRSGVIVNGLILEGEYRAKAVGTRTGPFANYLDTREGGLKEEEVIQRFTIEDLQNWFAGQTGAD